MHARLGMAGKEAEPYKLSHVVCSERSLLNTRDGYIPLLPPYTPLLS
jgi:hypothetical protein